MLRVRHHTSEPPGFVIEKTLLQLCWLYMFSGFLIKSEQPLTELPPRLHTQARRFINA